MLPLLFGYGQVSDMRCLLTAFRVNFYVLYHFYMVMYDILLIKVELA